MEQTQLLVVCALKRETQTLRRMLDTSSPFLTTGMGGARSAQRIRAHLRRARPRFLLFTGTAGQLDPGLTMGTVVSPRTWVDFQGDRLPCDRQALESLQATSCDIVEKGLTVHRPVALREHRLRLFQDTGASICDMESTAILAAALEEKIPSLVIKVVSDTAETGLKSFWLHFRQNMEILAGVLAQEVMPLLEDRGRQISSGT